MLIPPWIVKKLRKNYFFIKIKNNSFASEK